MPRSFSLLLKSSALKYETGWKTLNLGNHRAAELPGKYKRKAEIKRQYYKRIYASVVYLEIPRNE